MISCLSTIRRKRGRKIYKSIQDKSRNLQKDKFGSKRGNAENPERKLLRQKKERFRLYLSGKVVKKLGGRMRKWKQNFRDCRLKKKR